MFPVTASAFYVFILQLYISSSKLVIDVEESLLWCDLAPSLQPSVTNMMARPLACHEPLAEADRPVDVHTGHAKNLDSTLLLDSPSALTLDVGAISESFGLFLVVMSSPYQHTVAFLPHTQWVYDVIINNLYGNLNCIGRLFFNHIKSIK